MNTHDIDIELPPLPEAHIASYQTDSTMRRMELRTYSGEDMKAYARAAIEADRKRRGEPYAQLIVVDEDDVWPQLVYLKWVNLEPGVHDLFLSPQPTEPVSKTDWNNELSSWGDEDFIHIFHERPDLANRLRKILAEPVKSTCKKCNGTGVESTRFHGVWPNGEECLEPIKCDQCDGFGMTSAAGPVKSHLKVSYDDKGDCLYVVCDSNEPADAEEDDKGILYRRAISDGRLVGITIMNFMGPHAKWSDGVQRHAEPVHETARTAGNGAGSGMNTGSQAGAHDVIPYCVCGCNSDDCRVNGCLSLRQAQSAMAPGGGGMPAEPVKVPSDAQRWQKASALPRSWWRDAFNRIAAEGVTLDDLIDVETRRKLP